MRFNQVLFPLPAPSPALPRKRKRGKEALRCRLMSRREARRIAAMRPAFVVGAIASVLGYGMVPDRKEIVARIVLDDRSRLPWRFFGRLTTTALLAG